MRKPEQHDQTRDTLVIACGCIIGVAFTIEAKFIHPHNPAAAIFIVAGAALMATLITLRLVRR
ncbi:hypothetical protein MKK68_19915 [Methylobacterium sp. E-016]|uniref:hypothetical protein n=1 Tax=Methylobacterium sp. E-016 TaxID=2836556 RepID=UPI001FBB97A0|nr:hypothetical protein [Methylobacterium sp. E-016]MCJ2077881.1 hypothetical protein [Methylobacterium sp. E-016]